MHDKKNLSVMLIKIINNTREIKNNRLIKKIIKCMVDTSKYILYMYIIIYYWLTTTIIVQ